MEEDLAEIDDGIWVSGKDDTPGGVGLQLGEDGERMG